jgi:hypothetical protein
MLKRLEFSNTHSKLMHVFVKRLSFLLNTFNDKIQL